MIKEGVMIGGRYEILNRIGTGGMADVYRGRDHKLNRYVALKILKREFREDQLFVKKFQSEAQAAAGLMHPNIVNVYDVGEDRGLYFMVMELVEGITLKEYIQKKVRLTSKEVISITLQVCAGIEAAHNNGIVHRDIKPQNIMISKEGKVKVTDFGIAKATSSNTISTNAMGSVHYTSPEQARGGFSDAKSDIYSLGITMFEMVTGELPFDGDSTVSIALKHLQEDIKSPAEIVPDIPYSLERIILKCTQKNADKRYQTMGQLMIDLKHSLVDPEGDFVNITPFVNVEDTVAISSEELTRIQKEAAYELDPEDKQEDYEKIDYDKYDTEPKRGKRQPAKKKSDVNPNMAKVMKILTIVVIAIVAFIFVFAIGKATGLLKFNSHHVESNNDKKIKTPNFVGMTLEEAEKLAKKKGLTIKVVKEEKSTKYEKGYVFKQMTEKDTPVVKGVSINVYVSTGVKGKELTMVDVSGEKEADALRKLTQKGFKEVNISVEQKESDQVSSGLVIGTLPEAGEKVTEDTKIVVYVSKGAGKTIVPRLIDKTKEEAEAALKQAGLNGSVTEEYNSKKAGTVLSQGIDAGAKADKGTTVSYVVSKGPEPKKQVQVPNAGDLVGKSESSVKAILGNLGLNVKTAYAESTAFEEGCVIAISNAGGMVDENSTIVITISTGPGPEAEPEPEPAPNPNPNPGSQGSGNGTQTGQ